MHDHNVACTWEVEASGGLETAWITLRDGRLDARGRAVGLEPEPFWVDYALETSEPYVTRRLVVRVESAAGSRSLVLLRSADGAWQADGRVLPDLSGAIDCDLAFCPLTNTMPILRHRLHQDVSKHDLMMAFVSLPDLTVHPSEQGYEHLSRTSNGAKVRFTSGTFAADIGVDLDGLVVHYPEIATRLVRTPDRSPC
jgi:uncharacterized protein